MKPHLLKVSTPSIQSFSIRKEMLPNINNRWHYHPELELIQFHQGSGLQFIGDYIGPFTAGDAVLVGSNLPHYWKFDQKIPDTLESPLPFSTVIHFNENFWGHSFLDLPELQQIKMLVQKAKKGLFLTAQQNKVLPQLIENLFSAADYQKITLLLDCIHAFHNEAGVKLLSSQDFNTAFTAPADDRINMIYNFSLKNFNRKIELKEIAGLVNFEPNSFCRYFKSRTGKNYFVFLREIRVGQACKLLIENRLSLKQICFASGFNNFSCFHKDFKQITGKTPKEYQSAHLNPAVI